MTPILSSICLERRGKKSDTVLPKLRNVYPMLLTQENLKQFWEKARKLRNIFNVDVSENFETFLNIFTHMQGDEVHPNGFFWRIDDFVGVFYITDITLHDCLAHFMFFDRKLEGREELTKDMLRYLFMKYNFRRISVEIPKYATAHPHGFVQAIGFKREGRRRKATLYNGDWFDTECYGILYEDIITPSV